MREDVEVKLARLEEGMIRVNDKIDAYHTEVKGIIAPMKERQEKHHESIIRFAQDRKWTLAIIGFAFSEGAYLIGHYMLSHHG